MLAQLEAHRTRQDNQARLLSKFELIKQLYQRGYQRGDVLELLRLVDWMLALPLALEQQLETRVARFEEEQNVAYVTSFERIAETRGMERGMERGMQQGETRALMRMLVKQLTLKFGSLPPWAEQRIENAGIEELEQWGERVLSAETLDDVFA